MFGSGYLANAGIAPALVGRGDLVLIDELAHSSLWTGARLSRAEVLSFRHNDAGHVADLLEQHRAQPRARADRHRRRVLHGRRPRAARRAGQRSRDGADAWLMVDDAHDLDFDAAAVQRRRAAPQIGTLSKALGAYGGYLCASQPVIDLDPQPRPHADLFHRPAAGDRSPPPSPRST